MNYLETVGFINDTKKYGSILGLESIKRLLELLDNPQDKVKIIHIAGTNGKGSIFTFVQSVLREAKISTGRYTSPAVFEDLEIIQYNCENITENEFAECGTLVREACEKMIKEGRPHPTSFEIETAIAYLYFYMKKCEIALIETGMGGESDATNVEKSNLCSVFSSISLDHTSFLGDTIEEIAKVKSGIIRENSVVVSSKQKICVSNVLKEAAKKQKSRYVEANIPVNVVVDGHKTYFDYYTMDENGEQYEYKLSIKMMGKYQLINVSTAVEVIIALQKEGYNISKEQIKSGIEKSVWPGRLEVVENNPLVIIDGAHNPEAIEMLRDSIQMYFTNKRIAFIMGVLADKDYKQEAEIIAPFASKIYTITPDNVRALDGKKLAATISEYNDNVEFVPSIKEAYAFARQLYEENSVDMILAFGSLSYLGDLKQIINDANS